MASRAQSLTLAFVVWDTSANGPKVGDNANLTLRWVKDGTSSAPTNASSEIDATNAKGVYKITLTGTECTCDTGTLCGVSSTSNVVILPVTVTFERLPTAAPGADAGLPILSVSGTTLGYTITTLTTYTGNTPQTGDAFGRIGVAGVGLTNLGDARVAHLDADVSSRSTYAGGDTSGTTTLLTRLTALRAGYLDNVNNATLAAAVFPTDPADESLVIAATDAILARLGSPAGASLAADVAAIPGTLAAAHGAGSWLTGTGTSTLTTADIPTAAAVADKLLGRTIAGGADGGRTVKDALRFLRNRWTRSATTLVVYQEDDSTQAWTSVLTVSATASPAVESDPA